VPNDPQLALPEDHFVKMSTSTSTSTKTALAEVVKTHKKKIRKSTVVNSDGCDDHHSNPPQGLPEAEDTQPAERGLVPAPDQQNPPNMDRVVDEDTPSEDADLLSDEDSDGSGDSDLSIKSRAKRQNVEQDVLILEELGILGMEPLR
jgi:hypothetical protein